MEKEIFDLRVLRRPHARARGRSRYPMSRRRVGLRMQDAPERMVGGITRDITRLVQKGPQNGAETCEKLAELYSLCKMLHIDLADVFAKRGAQAR